MGYFYNSFLTYISATFLIRLQVWCGKLAHGQLTQIMNNSSFNNTTYVISVKTCYSLLDNYYYIAVILVTKYDCTARYVSHLQTYNE